MNVRQCFGVAIICGVAAIASLLFFKRNEIHIAQLLQSSLGTLSLVVLVVLFLLGVLFTIPISESDLQDVYYMFLITAGILQTCLGTVAYLVYPEIIAEDLKIPVSVPFQRDIGATFVAVGILYCVAGGTRQTGFAVVCFLVVFCWGRLVVSLISRVKKENTETDKTAPSNPYCALNFGIETYWNICCPIIFATVYMFAFTFV
jgi:small-conductance mechanosensitive channel